MYNLIFLFSLKIDYKYLYLKYHFEICIWILHINTFISFTFKDDRLNYFFTFTEVT